VTPSHPVGWAPSVVVTNLDGQFSDARWAQTPPGTASAAVDVTVGTVDAQSATLPAAFSYVEPGVTPVGRDIVATTA
jgi:hypothetical protein